LIQGEKGGAEAPHEIERRLRELDIESALKHFGGEEGLTNAMHTAIDARRRADPTSE